jgi:hypothetical protein
MDVQVFAICDAVTESGGKINLIGPFDEVKGPNAPLRVNCGIGGRIRFDDNEIGRKRVQLRILDSEGNQVFEGSSEVEVQLKPNGMSAIQFAVSIPILNLPRFGRYRLELLIDGRIEKSLPLLATQQNQPQIGPQPQMVRPP